MWKKTCPISKWVCGPHTHPIPKVRYGTSLWSTYTHPLPNVRYGMRACEPQSLWNAEGSCSTYWTHTVSTVSGDWRVRKTGVVGGWRPLTKMISHLWYSGVFRPSNATLKRWHSLSLIRTRVFKGAVGAADPWKKVFSSLVFRCFSTPWCYPKNMTHTLNLIRTCNLLRWFLWGVQTAERV